MTTLTITNVTPYTNERRKEAKFSTRCFVRIFHNDFFLLRRLDLTRSDCQLRMLHHFLFAFMGIHIFIFDTTGRLFGAIDRELSFCSLPFPLTRFDRAGLRISLHFALLGRFEKGGGWFGDVCLEDTTFAEGEPFYDIVFLVNFESRSTCACCVLLSW